MCTRKIICNRKLNGCLLKLLPVFLPSSFKDLLPTWRPACLAFKNVMLVEIGVEVWTSSTQIWSLTGKAVSPIEELCQTFCVSGPDGEAGSKHCKLFCCQGNFYN